MTPLSLPPLKETLQFLLLFKGWEEKCLDSVLFLILDRNYYVFDELVYCLINISNWYLLFCRFICLCALCTFLCLLLFSFSGNYYLISVVSFLIARSWISIFVWLPFGTFSFAFIKTHLNSKQFFKTTWYQSKPRKIKNHINHISFIYSSGWLSLYFFVCPESSINRYFLSLFNCAQKINKTVQYYFLDNLLLPKIRRLFNFHKSLQIEMLSLPPLLLIFERLTNENDVNFSNSKQCRRLVLEFQIKVKRFRAGK